MGVTRVDDAMMAGFGWEIQGLQKAGIPWPLAKTVEAMKRRRVIR